MFATLFGTWPTDTSSSRRTTENERSTNPPSTSGLNERSTFGGEDEVPSASSVFVVTSKNYPIEKVFIPPDFVPPGGSLNTTTDDDDDDRRAQDVSRRLQDALQRDAAATATASDEAISAPPDYANDHIDPAIHHLRRLAPKNVENVEKQAPIRAITAKSTGDEAQTAAAQHDPHLPPSRSPSLVPDVPDLPHQRTLNWTPTAHRAFHTMITAPNYVNRYRLSPTKQNRLLHHLRNPDVEPTKDDGSKDHQIKYQARNWVLKGGKLYRKAEGKSAGPGGGKKGLRRHLDVDEVWDVLTAEHLRSRHLGRDRLRKVLERRFIGYTLQEIMFVLRECKTCNQSKKVSASGTGSGTGLIDLDTAQEHVRPSLAQNERAAGLNNFGESSFAAAAAAAAPVSDDFPSAPPHARRKQTSNMMWF